MNVNFPPNLRKYFFFYWISLSLSHSQNWDTHYCILFFKPVLSISFFTHKKKIKFNSYCCKNIIIKSLRHIFYHTRIIVIVIFSKHAHINLHPMRTKFIIDILLSKSRAIGKIVCPNTILARTFTRTGAERLDWLEARKISKEDKEAESCGKDHAVIPVSIHD